MGRVPFLAQSQVFVDHGAAVVAPMRRGYGDTGGAWAEDYGPCRAPRYFQAGLEGAKDLEATVRFAAQDPALDATRVLLVGVSAGGWASVAAASRDVPGLVGVINFAGVRGSPGPGRNCSPEQLVVAMERYGARTRVPSLWIYAENDSRVGPALARKMFEAYRRGGADAELVIMPPFGKDGHVLFPSNSGVNVWKPVVDRFLVKIGLVATRR